MAECLHIASAFERAGDFDVIDNGFDFLPLTYCELVDTPVVTTIHGFSSDAIVPVYERYNDSNFYVAISDANRHPKLRYAATIHHGIDSRDFALREVSDDYLLFFGRIHPDKGTETAIEVARRAGRRLVIAGSIQDEAHSPNGSNLTLMATGCALSTKQPACRQTMSSQRSKPSRRPLRWIAAVCATPLSAGSAPRRWLPDTKLSTGQSSAEEGRPVDGQTSAENSHGDKGQNQSHADQEETWSELQRPKWNEIDRERSGGVGITVEEPETGEFDQPVDDPVAAAELEAIGRTLRTDQDAQPGTTEERHCFDVDDHRSSAPGEQRREFGFKPR